MVSHYNGMNGIATIEFTTFTYSPFTLRIWANGLSPVTAYTEIEVIVYRPCLDTAITFDTIPD